MAHANSVLGFIRELAETETTRKLAHGELLGRFVRQGDEAAFKALVRRHGPMVFRVCLRVLRTEQDAEDAFQATFLVLAKKAGALQQPESLSRSCGGSRGDRGRVGQGCRLNRRGA